MDVLKEELARKRKFIEDVRATKGVRFVRSSELEDMATNATQSSSETKPKQVEPLESVPETLPDNEGEDLERTVSTAPSLHSISRSEVIRRLRERLEPILLFGETQAESMERLKQLEMKSPEGMSGLQNDFLKAVERLDKEYVESLDTQNPGVMQGSHGSDVSVTSPSLTYCDVKSLTTQLRSHKESSGDTSIILNVLQFLISSWGVDLTSPSMYPHHSDTNRPSRITDSHVQISVIR